MKRLAPLLALLAACSATPPAPPADATLATDAVVVETGSSYPAPDSAPPTPPTPPPPTALLCETTSLGVPHHAPASPRARRVLGAHPPPSSASCVGPTQPGLSRQ